MFKKRELAPIVAFRRAEGTAIPLSFTQERLWFVNRLDPDSPAYNAPLAVRLTGRLELSALIGTLDEIVRRHEALRTKFVDIDGVPAQIIVSASASGSVSTRASLPLIDLRNMTRAEREAKLRELISEEIRRSFDVAKGPLLRCRLARLADNEHALTVVMHHIITDGWSLGIFLKEMGTIYANFTAGQPSPLPELRIQYADYANWQRARMQGEFLDEHLAYWKRQLAGAPSFLELPTDRPRPATQSFRGKRQTLSAPKEIADGLRELSRREGATLFMVLLAAFKALLFRYSWQSDLVVGTSIANRNRAEVEGIIGPLVNTLALRSDLSGESSYRELLRRVKQTALGAYAHQDLPFEKLVSEISPERDRRRNPIFQVFCAMQNAPLKLMEFSDLKLNPQQVEHQISKFDLSLVANLRHGFKIKFAYSRDLFDDRSITRMMARFLTLVEGVLAHPERRISEISLLTEAERNQLLEEWNGTERESSAKMPVHRLFALQAEKTPDAVAVAFKDRELSYAELNRRAHQLAHYLRRLGVGPESLVGVCVERSPEMIVGLLGVLKAGGAYAPLDPAYPKQRLEFMLEDSQAHALLTHKHIRNNLPPHPKTILLDLDWEAISRESAGDPADITLDEHPAYVIYTSGSTGKPKGVMIGHGGLRNLAEAQAPMFDIGPGSRLLQFASLSFDASVSEIFVALVSGATLVLATVEELMAGADLLDLLRRQAITTVTLPPAVLAALDPSGLPALRTLMSAGEACAVDILRRWGAGRRLLNGYGPTETTVAATTGFHTEKSESPDIGWPLPNTKVYILDEQRQPAPIGLTGNLHIGGAGLARGYHRRPDLTAEKFIPNPFCREPGARMYESGDLARYREDGKIEFIGRVDQQVKIGGRRIELGEIESALSEHPAIQANVVVVREHGEGNKSLIGYVVWAEGRTATTGELKTYLREKLPEHMVPSSFTLLDALPSLPNGKVNRAALPEPNRLRPEISREYQAARTELEAMLIGVWESVLSVERIGIHDNFFELGGNSLRAAIVINEIQKRLEEVVYIVALFDAPTVAELARYLEKHHALAVSESLGIRLDAQESPKGRLVDESGLAEIRRIIPPLPPLGRTVKSKNHSAIFILCPPRSGSTLLRVMLAGHPALFAPPELELLSFNTLSDRKSALSGKYGFWLEGTVRAVMEIKGYGADEARAIMEEGERRGMTVQEFYRHLQEWIGDRRLVDKTPAYALDLEVLLRAEDYFEDPLYIHLLRHPCSAIFSFEEARLDQSFFRYEHGFARRELAELVWTISQQNILAFLEKIPQQRQHRVVFEELVGDPSAVMRGVCDFLRIELHPEMLKPYQEKSRRMTDGIHPLSRMLGDVKFHEHSEINPVAADRWREVYNLTPLGEPTWKIAEELGYASDKFGAGDLDHQTDSNPEAAQFAPWAGAANGVIENIDQLSDQEVDSLLSGILAGEVGV